MRIKFIIPVILLANIFSCIEANSDKAEHATKNTTTVSTKDTIIHIADNGADYIVFGRFCGECAGECATMYKYDVVNKKLFVDHTDSYWKYNNGEPMKFETAVTDLKIHARIKELLDNLPDFILNTEKAEQQFGCPDCTDGCGLFFEIKKDHAAKKFYIDNQTSKLEGDVKEFAEDLQQILAKM